jgi:serralysin
MSKALSQDLHERALAADADDRIIYNKSTGALFYDPDGKGGTAAIQFAKVVANAVLDHTDILIA